MSKSILIITATIFGILVLVGGCGPQPQLLSDEGFEPEPAREKTEKDWHPSPIIPETQEFVSFEWDETTVNNGTRSVSIAIAPDHPEDVRFYNWTRRDSSFLPGHTYELSGWVKTEKIAGGASLMVNFWNEERAEWLGAETSARQFTITESTDWTEIGTVFTVPDGATKVLIRAGMPAPVNRGGRVWFDDIKVREIDLTEGLGPLEGMWSGTLKAQADMRLVLNVDRGFRSWKHTLDSVDEGANGMTVDNLQVVGDQVSFEMTRIHASYAGTLVTPDRIEGSWTQGMMLPLVFERTTEKPQLNRPQNPEGPFPYTIEYVAYSFDPENIRQSLVPKAADNDKLITIAGTLTIPPGEGTHPAVLLISGSGPQDRDETLFNHKPFWVLADHLSRQGLAVLRVDDRGIGQSTGNFDQATSADFSRDAAAGFLFLQQRADIDAGRIALLGHSEGGLVAPMVAVEYPEVAAIVLMAGPGVSGEEISLQQVKLLLDAQGMAEPRIESVLAQQQELHEILLSDLSEDELSVRLEDHFAERYESLTAPEQGLIGSMETYVKVQKAKWGDTWMRWFLAYDPEPTLEQVACPLLAVNGAKDWQVDPDQNLPAIAAALAAGGNPDCTTVELPELNHLFQHCETGLMGEYGLIEETLAPEFLETVTQWLVERLAVSP